MLPHRTTNTDTTAVATAAEVAARLPGTRPEGTGYRTRGYCHGNGDKPDSASLIFHDPDNLGASLHVHCFKCSPSTPAERDAIRHVLQKATGLQLCRCRQCWDARRQGAPGAPPARYNRRRHQSVAQSVAPNPTAELAASLWKQAQPSTGAAPPHHPVSRWIARHGIWPTGRPLPAAVRWLSRRALPVGHPDSNAAGALVMAMWQLDQISSHEVHKVQLVAIDTEGNKAQHWKGGAADKRTYGRGAAYGLLFHEIPDGRHTYDLHAVEGLKDGLNLLQALPSNAGQIVAVCAGTAYGGIEPLWFHKITLWPDGDAAGVQAAQKIARRWKEQHGEHIEISIKKLQPDQDPGAINWRTPQ